MAAGADYIITGNTKHFPERFQDIGIVTPRQFLDLIALELTGIRYP
jgi:hypothetical protein